MATNESKLSLKKGVREVNDQGRSLFNIVDALQEALNEQLEEVEIDSRFQRLRQNVDHHIRFEEALIQEYGILDYQGRQTDHASVIKNLRAFRDRYLAATDPEVKRAIPDHAVFLTREWLNKHMANVDRQYARYEETGEEAE